MSRLRWSDLGELRLLALPVHPRDRPAGLGGDLPGGLQVLLAEAAAGVVVEREDADGAPLRGQRQDHRRRRVERQRAGPGPGRVGMSRSTASTDSVTDVPACSAWATGEVLGSVSRRTWA